MCRLCCWHRINSSYNSSSLCMSELVNDSKYFEPIPYTIFLSASASVRNATKYVRYQQEPRTNEGNHLRSSSGMKLTFNRFFTAHNEVVPGLRISCRNKECHLFRIASTRERKWNFLSPGMKRCPVRLDNEMCSFETW